MQWNVRRCGAILSGTYPVNAIAYVTTHNDQCMDVRLSTTYCNAKYIVCTYFTLTNFECLQHRK